MLVNYSVSPHNNFASELSGKGDKKKIFLIKNLVSTLPIVGLFGVQSF